MGLDDVEGYQKQCAAQRQWVVSFGGAACWRYVGRYTLDLSAWDATRAWKGPDNMHTGTVKFFNADKGFGFITPDEGGNDVFVHITAVKDSGLGDLRDGQRVSFETEPDKRGKGPKAVNLQASE